MHRCLISFLSRRAAASKGQVTESVTCTKEPTSDYKESHGPTVVSKQAGLLPGQQFQGEHCERRTESDPLLCPSQQSGWVLGGLCSHQLNFDGPNPPDPMNNKGVRENLIRK